MSGSAPMLTLLGLLLLAPGTVATDPQNMAEAAGSGTRDVLQFATGDDILAGMNHLWPGPLLGLFVGGLAGLIRVR